MRWVNNNLDVSEKFLGFYEILDIKSSTIVTVMKDILLRYQLNLDMCRDQCYDCSTNMLGKSSGVTTHISAEQPKAHYTHCHAHSLLLSVKNVTKNTKILRDTMGTAEEITILIKYSPKRENILGSIKEQIECENDSDCHANNLVKLSETRWTVRAVCFKRFLDSYNVLWNVLKHCLQNEQMKTELKSRIIGFKTQMESFSSILWSRSWSQNFFPIPIAYLKPYRLKKCQDAAVKG